MKGMSVLLLVIVGLPRFVAAQCCRPPNDLAVFYFDNLSPDTSDLYLADGLTEALIERLGHIERLRVKSVAAVVRYRRVPGDPVAFAHALGVTSFVDGNVRRVGHELRVIAELVQTSSGDRLWLDTYDRGDAELLAIEDDIARAVAGAAAAHLDPAERRQLVARPTRSAAAYDHYIRGNYYAAQRRPAALARAIDEYERAVALDTNFAAAAAAAWRVRGLGLPADSALAAFDMAIRLNPREADAWELRGSVLRHLGRDSAAAVAYHEALAIDPERPITLEDLALLAIVQRRYDEARQLLDSALAVDSGVYIAYLRRAEVWLLLGNITAARRDAETGMRLGGGDAIPRACLAHVLAASGDTATARAMLDSLLAQVPRTALADAFENVAPALVAAGDRERAIALMEAVPDRGPGSDFAFGVRLPQFDPLRSDPRFQRLVESTRPR